MPLLLKITNTLVFLFFLGSNIYSVVEGTSDGWWTKHVTYLTPAPWAFWIWGVTYFLLAGFTMWQWIPNSEEVNVTVENVYSYHFALAGIASALWATLWKEDHLWLSALLILFAYHSLAHIVHNLYKAQISSSDVAPAHHSLLQRAFVHTPIYLWFHTTGFVLLLNILAIVTRGKYDEYHPSVWSVVATEIAFAVLLSHAIGASHVGDHHIPGNFIISWFLSAVAAQQHNAVIHWSAIVAGAIAFVYPLRVLLPARRSGETQPLLPGA